MGRLYILAQVKEIERLPFEGNGKPEPLKHKGWWSVELLWNID
jgi:Txe/YoeB family toxin of Txe-Axe toxin-antitoxin module